MHGEPKKVAVVVKVGLLFPTYTPTYYGSYPDWLDKSGKSVLRRWSKYFQIKVNS